MLRGFNYYKFNYKPDTPFYESGKTTTGVIAQEVKSKFDYAIIENKNVLPSALTNESYLGVNYIKFLPLVVNALREISTKVESISSKLNH
jgi:hypothetical protein